MNKDYILYDSINNRQVHIKSLNETAREHYDNYKLYEQQLNTIATNTLVKDEDSTNNENHYSVNLLNAITSEKLFEQLIIRLTNERTDFVNLKQYAKTLQHDLKLITLLSKKILIHNVFRRIPSDQIVEDEFNVVLQQKNVSYEHKVYQLLPILTEKIYDRCLEFIQYCFDEILDDNDQQDDVLLALSVFNQTKVFELINNEYLKRVMDVLVKYDDIDEMYHATLQLKKLHCLSHYFTCYNQDIFTTIDYRLVELFLITECSLDKIEVYNRLLEAVADLLSPFNVQSEQFIKDIRMDCLSQFVHTIIQQIQSVDANMKKVSLSLTDNVYFIQHCQQNYCQLLNIVDCDPNSNSFSEVTFEQLFSAPYIYKDLLFLDPDALENSFLRVDPTLTIDTSVLKCFEPIWLLIFRLVVVAKKFSVPSCTFIQVVMSSFTAQTNYLVSQNILTSNSVTIEMFVYTVLLLSINPDCLWTVFRPSIERILRPHLPFETIIKEYMQEDENNNTLDTFVNEINSLTSDVACSFPARVSCVIVESIFNSIICTIFKAKVEFMLTLNHELSLSILRQSTDPSIDDDDSLYKKSESWLSGYSLTKTSSVLFTLATTIVSKNEIYTPRESVNKLKKLLLALFDNIIINIKQVTFLFENFPFCNILEDLKLTLVYGYNEELISMAQPFCPEIKYLNNDFLFF